MRNWELNKPSLVTALFVRLFRSVETSQKLLLCKSYHVTIKLCIWITSWSYKNLSSAQNVLWWLLDNHVRFWLSSVICRHCAVTAEATLRLLIMDDHSLTAKGSLRYSDVIKKSKKTTFKEIKEQENNKQNKKLNWFILSKQKEKVSDLIFLYLIKLLLELKICWRHCSWDVILNEA